jgi:hypothetical protein
MKVAIESIIKNGDVGDSIFWELADCKEVYERATDIILNSDKELHKEAMAMHKDLGMTESSQLAFCIVYKALTRKAQIYPKKS